MSTKRIVTAPDAPAAVGPYSMGTLVGNMLYTCGCIGLDPKNGDLVSGGFEPQCRQALKNLGAILNAGGTNYKNAVKVTVLLADMAHFQDLNRIYAEYFSETPPVRTAYQVAKLPKVVPICGDLLDEVSVKTLVEKTQKEFGKLNILVLARCQFTHALGRPGTVTEVADTIAFLASDAASNITGATIPVDGGRHAICPR